MEAVLGTWAILWVLGGLVVGLSAEATGREIGFAGGLVISLFLSPFVGAIYVATSRKKDDIKRDVAMLNALQRIAAAYPELQVLVQSQATPVKPEKRIAQDGLDKINKLGEKLSSGKISREEYEKEKARLVDMYTEL